MKLPPVESTNIEVDCLGKHSVHPGDDAFKCLADVQEMREQFRTQNAGYPEDFTRQVFDRVEQKFEKSNDASEEAGVHAMLGGFLLTKPHENSYEDLQANFAKTFTDNLQQVVKEIRK